MMVKNFVFTAGLMQLIAMTEGVRYLTTSRGCTNIVLNDSKVVCYVDLITSLEPLGAIYLYESEISHRNINICHFRFNTFKVRKMGILALLQGRNLNVSRLTLKRFCDSRENI
jgi:hypothetical protein